MPMPSAKRAAPKPYKGVFYDNDFSYLEAAGYVSQDLFDNLKRIRPAASIRLDVGGEYRLRYHDENRLRGSRLNGLSDEFLLQRTRLYTDLWYAERLRAYAEYLDATSAYEDLPPRAIEENRSDFINLFGQAILWQDGCGHSLSARVGRQELLYGAERLVSPLDWSNTRRTFDGAKLLWKSQRWNIDFFWTRPVGFAQHIPNDHNFDNPDQSQQFYGLYGTYKGWKANTVDFYYLVLQEDDRVKVMGVEAVPGEFEAHTIGGRWAGSRCDWLWELEGGVQVGEFNNDDLEAGFCTLGLGRRFASCPWTPTLWAYYDWASGDDQAGDGEMNTFNHLFPLGHKYFGFADLVARQNIEAWNFRLTFKPHPKATVLIWYYIFDLAEARDALYNAAGVPIRRDPTGAAGDDVGNELDVTLSLQMGMHANLLLGYSRFYSGSFVSNTGLGDDADFFYTQFSFKF